MTFKHITYLSLLLCMTLSACSKGKNNWDDSSDAAAKSKTYSNAEEAIADMNETDWGNPDIYNQVREMEISDRKSLRESDRHALRSSLEEAYAKQLVRTCNNILASDCSPRHKTLNAAYKEFQSHDFGGFVPDGVKDMENAYTKHNENLKFSVSSHYGVALNSFLDSYNSAYDSQKRSEAQKIRASNPCCQEIKKKVSETHVNEVLAQRKQNYYAALASKFCNTPNPSIGDYNRLRSKLHEAKNATLLINKIEAHWNRIQESSNAAY